MNNRLTSDTKNRARKKIKKHKEILEMFSIGDIAGMGFEMIEERLRETDYAISRQTMAMKDLFRDFH